MLGATSVADVFATAHNINTHELQNNNKFALHKEKIESRIEILSPKDGEIVDPLAPLTIKISYEAWHFNFSIKDKYKTVKPSSFDAIELLLDGKSVALQELDKSNNKTGVILFEVSHEDFPDDTQEVELKARAYRVYHSFEHVPEKHREKVKNKSNKVAVESEKVSVQFGIDIEAIRAEAQEIIDTNPNGDNDNDGLTNKFEIVNLDFITSSEIYDTDANGISDANEDEDNDGLLNIEEQTLGTNPLVTDTDSDGLTDKEEVNIYGTDPNNEDTDGDGLSDGLEVELGTNPLNPDTDGDGVSDGDDSIEFLVHDETSGILVEVTGSGKVKRNFSFLPLNNEPFFANAPAFISSIEINNERGEFIDEAIITIPFDLSTLGGTNPSNLGIAYLNNETGEMEPLENQIIDMVNNTVSGKTNHFSKFVLYDMAKMAEIFAEDFFGSVRGGGGSIVLVFSIDSSGSMRWNDPSNIRKDVSKDLIDSLETDDKVGVVDLDSSAYIVQEITTDKETAKNAIDQINSSGGTNIGAAVTTANTMLINEPEDGNKIQILLTDGQGSYNPSYTQQAIDNGIIIYTIGLGSSVDEMLLRSIAEETGGAYFQVSQASDLISVFATLKEATKDTDGDGLSDSAEINGMRTFWGTVIISDPSKFDSDGDGLSDGEEMGSTWTDIRGRYYNIKSDPNNVDSDGDGLSDQEEKIKGTLPYIKDTDGDGLSDKEEIDGGTDPLLEDTDSDGLNDRIDPMPTRKDFYGDLDKIGDVVAILTVFADPTENILFTSFSYSLDGGSHAFIAVKNVTNKSIDVGKFPNLEIGESLSLGTWGPVPVASEHIGLWYSLESWLIQKQSAYNGRISISYALNSTMLDKLTSWVGSHDKWSELQNCSSFAKGVWNEIAPWNYEVSNGWIINTPKTLAENIRNTWPLEYRITDPLPLDNIDVYYANGTDAIIKSSKYDN
ncbi:MAG: VWA domain-containing protein [Patescibacteria group bacterium]|nr:VWA domain-containing protein [Patescibacteria group bacterium]